MKTRISIILAPVLLALSTLNSQYSTAFAQGSLTPSGPPAATMRTLSQVEPRVPISSAPFVITQPGAYYLTTNIATSTGDAIDISTNGVTLDLNGFTISSTLSPANGSAIGMNSGISDITILNGHIESGVTNNGGTYSGSGFAMGILGTTASDVLVKDVSIAGVYNYGIYIGGSSTTVESCTVNVAGAYGIVANNVFGSTALNIGSVAIAATAAKDCYGAGNNDGIDVSATAESCYGSSSGYGIQATTTLNCEGYSSGGGDGISCITAQNCYGSSNSGSGLVANAAQNCQGYAESGANYGLYAYTAQNCLGSNYGSGYGLYAEFSAIGCYGFGYSGTGLYALIANICHGETYTGTGLSTPNNVNSY